MLVLVKHIKIKNIQLLKSILIILLSALSAFSAYGQQKKHYPTTMPIKCKIGVDLLDVSELNLKKSTCLFDMYLVMRPDRPWNPGAFEVMNSTSTQGKLSDNYPLFKSYRVFTRARQNYNFINYPFMNHDLYLAIEDQHLDIHHLVYIPDPKSTCIDPDFKLEGWYPRGHRWIAKVVVHYYVALDEIYSRYIFMLPITRDRVAAFMNDLLPVIIFAFAGLSSLFYKPWKTSDKIAILLAALLASVLHHQLIRNSLPGIGYLTFFDKFIITNYITFLLCLVFTAWAVGLYEIKGEEQALKFDAKFRIIAIGGWFVMQSILVLVLRARLS